ncbi:hypothetical protein [Actinomadura rayongensis]|uniref:Uncharacterized protein n=1 Tax=Actinomadura rayongensis TaxID=1429076 RepID=A0A6I4WHJ4_9ACTN|nr:hypothetical protein [Actinomadura rayongensis]MXQ66062.1 hypothetical protein [Actinomadura rayongensis]
MTAPFGAAVVLYGVLLAVLAGWSAVVGRPRPGALPAGLVVLEGALLVQAGVDLAGPRAAEPGVHLGYLVTSVVLLPVAGTAFARDRGRWACAALAAVCVAVAVVTVRLHATGAPRA